MKRNSYFKFLVSRGQLADWLVIAACVIAGTALMLLAYPHPIMISDSFGYLLAAIENHFVAFRPFGYSFFLRFLHLFSRSLYSVVVSQAILYIISLGMFTLAVKKYCPFHKSGVFLALEALVALSPLSLFMLNAVLSDALSCCCIFVLLAMVIVMLKEGSFPAMVIYLLTLFCSLHLRYISMFFPIAFIPVLLFVGNKALRYSSIVLTVLCFLVFHGQICKSMEEITGKRQFSTGFDGWQLANNGLHVIPYLDEAQRRKMPDDKELAGFHKYCLSQTDYIASTLDRIPGASAEFMWDNNGPLKQCMFAYMQHYNWIYYEAWVRLGSGIFADYGKWLALTFPGKYIVHYILPNSKSAFMPYNTEIVGLRNTVEAGKSEVVQWFNVPPDKTLVSRDAVAGGILRAVLPWIEVLTWLVLIAGVVFYFVRKRKDFSKTTRLILLLLFLFGFIYYGTTVVASSVALRYWMPMHAVKLLFAGIVFFSLPDKE